MMEKVNVLPRDFIHRAEMDVESRHTSKDVRKPFQLKDMYYKDSTRYFSVKTPYLHTIQAPQVISF